MINGEKYVNGSWVTSEIPTRKLHNATDNITSLPVDIYTDGQTVSADIIGNLSQSGIPTPTTPITPSECGDLVNGNYILPIKTGVTTNVNLNETQSTRKIKKLILTGNETFTKNDTNPLHYLYYTSRGNLLPNSISKTPILCNELPVTDSAPQFQLGISSNNNFNVVYLNFGADVMDSQTSGNSVDGLKEYLAAQYAAGTPVTVWYVLATPQTTTLNEPIRKIGDYADSISVVSIPTTAGGIEFDVDTSLKPSEVDLTYHGWHDISPLQRVNGEWV